MALGMPARWNAHPLRSCLLSSAGIPAVFARTRIAWSERSTLLADLISQVANEVQESDTIQ